MKPNIFTKNIFKLTLGFAVLSTIAQAQVNFPSASSTYPTGSATVYTPSNFAAGIKLNYVRTIVPTYAITSEWYLNPTDPGATRVTTNYYDGLGRLIQTVAHFASPNYNDIVTAVKYDQFGRDAYRFLPYSIGEASADYNGKFKLTVYSDQKNFYKNQLGYTTDNYFYSQTNYDASPLNTPNKSMSAGSSWVGSGRGTTVTEIPLVANSNIRCFTISQAPGAMPTNAGVYGTAELMVKTTTDEDGFFIEEYTNKTGLVVLKTTGKTGVATKLLTYYVYDDFDLLRCTIPPKATEYLAANSWTMNATIFKELCFNYEYDGFSRVVIKNEPGIGSAYTIYNRKDQMQFTQTATQRAKGEWMFYKYDVLGRMTQTGLYMSTSSAQSMHGLSNNPYPGSDPFLVYLFKDTYGNASYVSSFTNAKVLTTNYYDDYSFTTRTFDQNQMFNLTAGFYSELDSETKNYLTGTKTVVLDGAATPTELTTVNFYAKNGMLLQTQAQNHKGGWIYTSNTYNFLNEKLGTYTEINNPQAVNNTLIKTNETFYFDHAGRSLGNDHDLNGAGPISTPANRYDDAGRLTSKIFANNDVNSINFEYNVRGWLTGINKGYCLVANSENTFGMEISYNYGFATNYYNGNIAGIKWRNSGASQELRAYGYKYDNYNRLQTADFAFKLGDYSNANAWGNGALDFTASNITYDANGNLATMKQMGKAVGGAKIILDDLTYGYTSNTNKLVSVSESASSQSKSPTTYDKLGDFRDVAGATDYTYDADGNLLTDANKSITYTYDEIVNKTKRATKGTQNVDFLYDARGNKLQKKVSGGSTTTTTDYVGSAIYINNGLSLITHPEGRVRYNATATNKYMYDYYIKDHLGSTRSVVTYTNGAIEGFMATADEDIDKKEDEIVYKATSELDNAAKEDQLFYNITETRANNPLKKTENDNFVARLTTKDNKSAIGPEIMIKVMTGDKIKISAEALILDEQTSLTTIAKDIVDNVIVSIATVPVVVKEGIERIVIKDLHHLNTEAFNTNDNESENGKVKAFLNYMLYDEDMKLIAEGCGSIQIKEKDGWQTLQTEQLTIPHNGFIKLYTENKDKRTVYINNTTLAILPGKLVEEFHYYPFGLVFGASSFGNTSIKQTDFLYTGKELQRNEFAAGNGLELADYGARMYDSQIGRWTAPDPLAEKRNFLTPYNYCQNNPINRNDPTGALDGESDDTKKKDKKSPEPAKTQEPKGREVKADEVKELISTGKTVQDRVTNLAKGIKVGEYITSSTLLEITNTPAPKTGEKADVTAQRDLIKGIDKVVRTSNGFTIILKDGKKEISQSFDAIGGAKINIKNNAMLKFDFSKSTEVVLDATGVTTTWMHVPLPKATIKKDEGSVLGFSFKLIRE